MSWFSHVANSQAFQKQAQPAPPRMDAMFQHIRTVVGSFLLELGICHAFLEKLSATLILNNRDGMKCTFESEPRGRKQYLAFLSQQSHLRWHWFKGVRMGLRGWIRYFISYKSPFSLLNNWMLVLKARVKAGWWKGVPETVGWELTEDQIKCAASVHLVRTSGCPFIWTEHLTLICIFIQGHFWQGSMWGDERKWNSFRGNPLFFPSRWGHRSWTCGFYWVRVLANRVMDQEASLGSALHVITGRKRKGWESCIKAVLRKHSAVLQI